VHAWNPLDQDLTRYALGCASALLADLVTQMATHNSISPFVGSNLSGEIACILLPPSVHPVLAVGYHRPHIVSIPVGRICREAHDGTASRTCIPSSLTYIQSPFPSLRPIIVFQRCFYCRMCSIERKHATHCTLIAGPSCHEHARLECRNGWLRRHAQSRCEQVCLSVARQLSFHG
jgi:hypothetical protein